MLVRVIKIYLDVESKSLKFAGLLLSNRKCENANFYFGSEFGKQ